MPPGAKPSREKVRTHRELLHSQGLCPIRVPDVRSPSFRAEAHRCTFDRIVAMGGEQGQIARGNGT
jgi:hypothetical protein